MNAISAHDLVQRRRIAELKAMHPERKIAYGRGTVPFGQRQNGNATDHRCPGRYDHTAGENVAASVVAIRELQWLIWEAGAKFIDIFDLMPVPTTDSAM